MKNAVYICSRKNSGLVVQLVRIHACHAWGREFESRPDRQPKSRVPQPHRLGDFCFSWLVTSSRLAGYR